MVHYRYNTFTIIFLIIILILLGFCSGYFYAIASDKTITINDIEATLSRSHKGAFYIGNLRFAPLKKHGAYIVEISDSAKVLKVEVSK